jgi:hypothetical protein
MRYLAVWIGLGAVALSWITGAPPLDRFGWIVFIIAIVGSAITLTTYGEVFNLVLVILFCALWSHFIYLK